MVHPCLKLGEEIWILDLFGLEVYFILECGTISERYLFIKSLLAYPVFPFERVKSVYIECNIRKCDGV